MSQTFSEQRSAARFEKVAAVIRKVFVNHPEEAEEALEIAKGMQTHARADVVAKVASEVGVDPELKDFFAVPSDSVSRPALTRELTAGNPWIHGDDFEKSFRRATSPVTFDASWHEPIGGVVQKSSDAPLAKSVVLSEMFSTLEKIRKHCTGDEAELLEKAARAYDMPAFLEISRNVFARVEAQAVGA
jgi:hypothetical protein